MKRVITMTCLLSVALALGGCGSGGGGSSGLSYTGTTTAAVVDSSNAQPLAESSTEAAQHAITDSQGASANPFAVVISGGVADVKSKIKDLSKILLENSYTNQLPVGITITSSDLNSQMGGMGITFCGGNVTMSNSLYNATTAGSGSITFNSLCIDYTSLLPELGQVTVNGTLVIDFDDDGGLSAGHDTTTFTDFTITRNGKTLATLNGSESCTWTGAGYAGYTCTNSSFYSGSGGGTFKLENADVSGNGTSGWDVTATVYHPDYGYVTITATGLTFNCSNGHPDAGHIEITGSGGTSITIDFIDCDTYTGSYVSTSGAGSLNGW